MNNDGHNINLHNNMRTCAYGIAFSNEPKYKNVPICDTFM